MADGDTVVYRIDGNDKITFVNQEWDRFAAANAAESLVGEGSISNSVWNFISDETTQQIYRDMLKRIRSGRRIRFPFRCDAPDCRRRLEMNMSPLERGSIEFQVRTLALEKRPPQALLDIQQQRSSTLLRMCAWCKKVWSDGAWLEIEEAIVQMNLLDAPSLPMLTHTICEECDEQMAKTIDED